MSRIVSFENRGFQVEFPNGWVFSAQWGTHNNCSVRDLTLNPQRPENLITWDSETVEIAAWSMQNGREIYWDFFNEEETREVVSFGHKTVEEMTYHMNEIMGLSPNVCRCCGRPEFARANDF